ncbi:LysE family translocator [Geothermobacter hydrogeniphilus]|uniref:Threonine transporter RhtB n=1 Tax=Geothermobacter hydrogeniphilus TaxID=1969733 RepID=A0A1X0Y061_9BACT|nr:LysE family translocator [Geothermobacter hydrogeniphilus]ORJ58575.1 threonine transporter RhtB [Geothermobacter hydrogeniphilus]
MDHLSLAAALIAITILTLTPGVDTMLIIRNTARGGWRDGAVSSLGICSSLFLHAGISAVGISVILMQVVWAFSLLKLAGGAYLVWLGLTSLRKGLRREIFELEQGRMATLEGFAAGRSLREGFLSNLLNPKAVVFYMAFLPQFIDPARSALLQSFFLAGCHFTIAMLWQCLLALMVRQVKGWLQRPRVSQWFHGLTGTVLVALGLRMAVKHQ